MDEHIEKLVKLMDVTGGDGALKYAIETMDLEKSRLVGAILAMRALCCWIARTSTASRAGRSAMKA